MAAFHTILDLVLILAAVLGSGFLIANLQSRFICNLPDSRPKVLLEIGLHLLSAIIGLGILARAVLHEGDLFAKIEGWPVATIVWFGYLALCLAVFVAYVAIALVKKARGPFRDPSVRVEARPTPYASPVQPPLPRVNQLFDLELVEIEIQVPGLDPGLQGLTVGNLTDFHLGKFCQEGYVRFAIDQLMEQEPELLAVTGDFVNYPRYLDKCFKTLEGVTAPLGVYAVRGNHDYWVGAEETERGILDLGMTLLHDRAVEVERNGATLLVAGIESPWNKAGIPFDFIPADSDRLKIVLSHTPDEFPKLAKQNPHLVMSGHTHGGQICFPFFGPVVVPSNYGRKYDRGLFKIGDSLLYVSKGIGCHPPLRTLCKPEVTLFRFL